MESTNSSGFKRIVGLARSALWRMAGQRGARRHRLGRDSDLVSMVDFAEMPGPGAPAESRRDRTPEGVAAAPAARGVRLSQCQVRAAESFSDAFNSTSKAWNETSLMSISNPLRLENVKEAFAAKDPAALVKLIVDVMGPMTGGKASNSFAEVNRRHAEALQVILQATCEIAMAPPARQLADQATDAATVSRVRDGLLEWVQHGQMDAVLRNPNWPLAGLQRAYASERRLALISLMMAGIAAGEDGFEGEAILSSGLSERIVADKLVQMRLGMVAPALPALASIGIVARVSAPLMDNILKNANAWNAWARGDEPSAAGASTEPSAEGKPLTPREA